MKWEDEEKAYYDVERLRQEFRERLYGTKEDGMSKESNGVTMHAAPAGAANTQGGRLYIEDASERDTDPEITQDYIKSVPVAVRLTLFERLRLWVGRWLARAAWRLMP